MRMRRSNGDFRPTRPAASATRTRPTATWRRFGIWAWRRQCGAKERAPKPSGSVRLVYCKGKRLSCPSDPNTPILNLSIGSMAHCPSTPHWPSKPLGIGWRRQQHSYGSHGKGNFNLSSTSRKSRTAARGLFGLTAVKPAAMVIRFAQDL
jgi:hypothetical protein